MIYKVSVSFNRDFIVVEGDHIEIGVMTKPVKGKANLEIIKKIAKHFGVSKSAVRIMTGTKSQDKIVEIVTTNPKK